MKCLLTSFSDGNWVLNLWIPTCKAIVPAAFNSISWQKRHDIIFFLNDNITELKELGTQHDVNELRYQVATMNWPLSLSMYSGMKTIVMWLDKIQQLTIGSFDHSVGARSSIYDDGWMIAVSFYFCGLTLKHVCRICTMRTFYSSFGILYHVLARISNRHKFRTYDTIKS